MDMLDNEFLQVHQEEIRREARLRLALRQAGLIQKRTIDRGFTMLGDLLIRMGTRLKEHAYSGIPTEEASAPSYLIML